MTESLVKSMIETACNIPVFEAADSIIFPGATVVITQYNPELFGDGKATARVNSATVDLWYTNKADRDAAVTAFVAALEQEALTTSPDIFTLYDTTAKKWRATLTFEFT